MKPKVTDFTGIAVFRLDGQPKWREVLAEGSRIIDKHFPGKWQLGFGTLLGAIRQPDHYIHHDIDLDVDLMIDNPLEEDTIKAFIEDMVQHGFSKMRAQTFEYKGRNLTMSMAFSGKDRTVFDVCILRKFGDDYLHIGKEGIVIRPAYSRESIDLKMLGTTYPVPKEYDKYLRGRYGNWKVPERSKGHWYKDASRGDLFIPMKFN